MFARFLWFFSLIATITTYSMAFQCYQGDNEATTEVTCNLGWCLNGTLPSGDVKYICDSSGACPIFGKGCHDNQAVELGGFKALCCCNSDLCNKGRGLIDLGMAMKYKMFFSL
uniref:Uncharacterized protein n=1 Tax=Plectus sambesii TaxID=2011161 RepID=A0A914VNX2_9BILA